MQFNPLSINTNIAIAPFVFELVRDSSELMQQVQQLNNPVNAIHDTLFGLMTLAHSDLNYCNAILQAREWVLDYFDAHNINEWIEWMGDDSEDLQFYNCALNNAPLFNKSEQALISISNWFNSDIFAEVADTIIRIAFLEKASIDFNTEEKLDTANTIKTAVNFTCMHSTLMFAYSASHVAPSMSVVAELIADSNYELHAVNYLSTFSKKLANELSYLLLQTQAASIKFMESGRDEYELIADDNDVHRDIDSGLDEVLGIVSLPDSSFNPTRLVNISEIVRFKSIVKIDMAMDNLEDKQRIHNSLAYSLGTESCNCEHDCCGCVSMSVMANEVKGQYVALSVSKQANY